MKLLLITCIIQLIAQKTVSENEEARAYLKNVNQKYAERLNAINRARFEYTVNADSRNREKYLEALKSNLGSIIADWKKLRVYKAPKTLDESMKRQFNFLSCLGELALGSDGFSAYANKLAGMQEAYLNGYIRAKDDVMKREGLADVLNNMANLRNASILQYEWTEFRKVISTEIRNNFENMIGPLNNAAQLNKFRDASLMWLDIYKGWDVKDGAGKLWSEIKPLYEQLHAYMRNHLIKLFSGQVVSEKGMIPEHLLGDMYAKSWSNLYTYTLPYSERLVACDWKSKLKRKYTAPVQMYKSAEDFFLSLGFDAAPSIVYDRSVLDCSRRQMMDLPIAWNFFGQNDYRISTCGNSEIDSFMESHVMMGLIHYFMEYAKQPYILQEPANPAVGLVIGDTLTISANTLKHLAALGMSPNKDAGPADNVNLLFISSLYTIAPMPFYLAADTYRWQVFTQKIKPKEFNCKWWKLVGQYQGVEPPVDRSDSDFDVSVIPEILTNTPLIDRFMSTVLKFQIHKSICAESGEYKAKDPNKILSLCYLYGNDKIAPYFKTLMEWGRLKQANNALQSALNISTLDTGPLLEYYDPLYKWLLDKNKENKISVGWEKSSRTCGG